MWLENNGSWIYCVFLYGIVLFTCVVDNGFSGLLYWTMTVASLFFMHGYLTYKEVSWESLIILIMSWFLIFPHIWWNWCKAILSCWYWQIWVMWELLLKWFENVLNIYLQFCWNNFGSLYKCPEQRISTVPGCWFTWIWTKVNNT